MNIVFDMRVEKEPLEVGVGDLYTYDGADDVWMLIQIYSDFTLISMRTGDRYGNLHRNAAYCLQNEPGTVPWKNITHRVVLTVK